MLLLPRLALTALVLAAIATAEDQGDQTGRILLPKDWRHFMHIKTMVIQPGNPLFEAHGGLHNVYGNGKAVGVLQAGGTAYPDGAVLFLGTMFAPTQDRGAPGQGFTHKTGDIGTVAAPKLGRLVNRMERTDRCEPWAFGASALMRNLAGRGLL